MGIIQEKPKSSAALKSALPWVFAYLGVLVVSLGLGYYWRVVFQISQLPLVLLALVPAVVGSVLFAALLLARRFLKGNVPAMAAVFIFLLGLLFCFAVEPLQVPDEPDRFLRAYAISEGQFNYDYTRSYPEDVNYLLLDFPHAHNHMVRYDKPDELFSQLAPSNFARYFEDLNGGGPVDEVREPVVRMIIPFLPQAAFIAVARLFGFTALGCMYAARIANLLCYALVCFLAFKNCARYRALFVAAALLPMSLYLGASCSLDSLMLAACFLVISYYCKESVGNLDLITFFIAFAYACVVKPVNVVLAAVLLLIPKERWKVSFPRWAVALFLAVVCAVLYFGAGIVNGALSVGYVETPDMRSAGGGASPGEQFVFVLQHIPRFVATLGLSFYEGDGFITSLGVLGSTDMAIPLAGWLSLLSLAAACALSVREKDDVKPRGIAAIFATAAVYALAAMAGIYIAATSVGDIRVSGLQTRYFLPVFLLVFLAFSVWLGKAVRPRLSSPGGDAGLETACMYLAAAVALVTAVLVFQNTFIGQWFTKLEGGHKMVNLFGWQVL